jgi:transcription elongation factor/antiterminator RfaH
MPLQWYALRSKPRKEDIVWRQVRSQEIESFYPRLRVNPVNPRARKLIPYFPGYLFIHVDLEEIGLSVFQWMPHSTGLVTFGGEPAPVPENLIFELNRRITEIAQSGGEVFYGLKPGDKVIIEDGPFRGYEAIFDARLPGTERVRVLLELLGSQRQIPVELNSGQIRQVKQKNR